MAGERLARRDPARWVEWAIGRLDDWGLALDSDRRLPSVPSMVVDRPVRGSWWSDPDSHLIYDCKSRLEAHPDVLHAVLVSGKGTLVHRRLWPAFIAVALAAEDWKVRGMSNAAADMWQRLQRDGRLTADEPGLPSTSARANGAAMRELEARLLCAGGNVHSDRGAHAKFVMTWSAWQAERRISTPEISAADGRGQLEECVARLNRDFGGQGKLPWQHRPTRGL
jgi:hypothetical protein